MGMTEMLAEAWKGMMRRRRQRLALAELMRMTPRQRDELGIDLVGLREASARCDRVVKDGTIHLPTERGKGRGLPPWPAMSWES